jgi:hypothetical protein
MPRTTPTLGLPREVIDHLDNVAANLQLIADLWYGDASLAVVNRAGELGILNDARPSTAADPIPGSRAGLVLGREDEPEAYRSLERRERVMGIRRDTPFGQVTTEAYPIGSSEVIGVVLRAFGEQVESTTSRMENAFIDAARELLATRCAKAHCSTAKASRSGPSVAPVTGCCASAGAASSRTRHLTPSASCVTPASRLE